MESKLINLVHINKQEESPKIGRERNNPQSKGKEESPEGVLNEIKANNVSDVEFKIMIIRMFKELSESYKETYRIYKEVSEHNINMKKAIATMSKSQEEMKNTISQMKNTLEGIKSRLDEAEDQISNLEDKVGKIPESNKMKKTQKE